MAKLSLRLAMCKDGHDYEMTGYEKNDFSGCWRVALVCSRCHHRKEAWADPTELAAIEKMEGIKK